MRISTTALLVSVAIIALAGESFAGDSVRHVHVKERGRVVEGNSDRPTSARPSMRYYGGPKSSMWRG
jgi:hypothetical protein